VNDGLFERAQRWASDDPDPAARAELERLAALARTDAAARADLTERFTGPLAFGTAGLRGLLGAGESRMNRAVVRRTTAGLARYLQDTVPGARERGVVIGYDGRRMSREFAEDAASVLAAAGIRAHLSPTVCPTPVAAYATKRLGAAAGVMITASHNPPAYNGYKVYWGNGAQIIPPHDTGIAAAIDASPAAREVTVADLAEATAKGLVAPFPADLVPSYLDAVLALSARSDGDRARPIVYTPLHGVGLALTRAALERAGFSRLSVVAEQAEPDGAFPTVEFPNPEEKGALDLAFSLADKVGADLVIANDPDVDRLAAAVRAPSGKLVQLTGNQVGVLLGHYLLTERRGDEGRGGDRLVLASIVSSPMLGVIARALGVRYEETLTGFKWIANRAMDLERDEGLRFVFGYEEALGYTVGSLVRDKDGISAALLLAELAAVRAAEGKTLLDELDDLGRRYGVFASTQRSITMPGTDGLARIAAAMDRLRGAAPDRIGPAVVVATSDFVSGVRTAPGGASSRLTLPPTNMVIFELEGSSRIIARPSGTEPKIKLYLDVREESAQGEPLEETHGRALAKASALEDAVVALSGLG
jgi:phosphomannomutase